MSDQVIIEDDALAPGFTQIPNAVLRRPDITPGAKVAYMVLLSYAWQKGSSHPGQKTMAKDCGVTERSVRTYVQELKRYGLISVQQRGLGKTNIYIIRRLRPEMFSGEVDTDRLRAEDFADQERKSASGQERKDLPPKNTQLEEYSKEEEGEGGGVAHDEDAAMTGATAPPTQERVREIMGRAHASKRQRVKW